MTACKLPIGLQGRGFGESPTLAGCPLAGQCYGLQDSGETFPERGKSPGLYPTIRHRQGPQAAVVTASRLTWHRPTACPRFCP